MTQELRDDARRREKEAREMARRREEFARDLVFLASRPEGRRFLRWCVEEGNILAEGYLPGPMGIFETGRRSVAVRLVRLLREVLPSRLFAAVTLPREYDDMPTGRETAVGATEKEINDE